MNGKKIIGKKYSYLGYRLFRIELPKELGVVSVNEKCVDMYIIIWIRNYFTIYSFLD